MIEENCTEKSGWEAVKCIWHQYSHLWIVPAFIMGFVLGAIIPFSGDFFESFKPEMLSIGLTITALYALDRWRQDKLDEKRLKKQLIREAGSRDNSTAVSAVDWMVSEEWIYGDHSILREQVLDRADLRGADLNYANLSRIEIQKAKLDNAELQGADLRCSKLNHTTFEKADMQRSNLSEAELVGANLKSAKLINAILIDSNLFGVKMQNSDARSVDCSGANMEGSNCESARMNASKFVSTRLVDCNLRNARLTNSDFTNANLQRAKVQGASFKNSIFKNTIMPDGTIYSGDDENILDKFTDENYSLPSHGFRVNNVAVTTSKSHPGAKYFKGW